MRQDIVERSKFSKFRKLATVRDYITNNQTHFVAGNEITTQAIFNAFGLSEPDYSGLTPEQVISKYHYFANERAKLTKRFNNVLAQRGMYIKKKHKEDIWCIKNNTRVEAKIERLHAISQNTQRDGLELERGYEIYSNVYSRVANAVLKRVAARLTR